MDILLACGVNNSHCDTAESIIFSPEFSPSSADIKNHSADNNHSAPKHRVVISTIHSAPKYADANLHPAANMTEKVRLVNSWITEFNATETGSSSTPHGVRGDPQVDNISYKFDEWNEKDRRKMLHLPFVKSRIAKDLL